MTQDFINDFNIKCAKFLKFKTNTKKTNWKYTLDDNSFFTQSDTDLLLGYIVSYMKFHSDWNWIHEVYNKIREVDLVLPMNGVPDSITPLINARRPVTKAIIDGNKESLIYAIDQFLDWYNENKK